MSGAGGANTQDSTRKQRNLPAATWEWLSAIRVAIGLFILWAALSALGTLVPQGQPEALYLDRYGGFLGRLIWNSGLHHAYTSFPYVVVLALFLASVFVCSVERIKRAWRRTVGPGTTFSPEQIKNTGRHRLIVSSRKIAASDVAAYLRRLGFAVTPTGKAGSQELLLGRRGRIAPWGMVAVHLSLLVVFIGALVGRTSWFGGFDGTLVIPEGDTVYDEAPPQDVPQHAAANWSKRFDFGIRLQDFWIDRDETGFIKEYTSRVDVVDGGRVVKTADVMVNKPLIYKGVKIYQSSYFTEAARVEVTTPDGITHALLFPNENVDDPQAPYAPEMLTWPDLTLPDGSRMQFFAHDCAASSMQDLLPGQKGQSVPPGVRIKLFVVGEKGKAQNWPQVGWVSAQAPVDYQGMKFRFAGLVDATVLSARRDPGLPLVWFGCALGVLGMLLGLYVRETTIRVAVSSPAPQRTEILAGVSASTDSQSADAYLARLEKALAGNR